MTEVAGVLTTLSNQIPAGIDPSRFMQWRLNEGRTYGEVRSMIAAAMQGLNAELLAAWGDLIYVTPDDSFEYPNGGAVTDLPEITEVGNPDANKGTTIGHMIDLKPRGGKIGGTWRFFRDTREAIIMAAVSDLIQRGRQTFEKSLLQRAMAKAETTLGTSGYAVGFCNANPGTLQYVPPTWQGKAFDTSHTHYLGYDSGSKSAGDMLDGLVGTVQEHGHSGPYIAYVSETDVITYRALPNFVKPLTDRVIMVDRGGSTTGAELFQRGMVMAPPVSGGRYFGNYISPYGEVELRSLNYLTTGRALVYKSYGANNAQNPMAVRIHPDVGFGFFIREKLTGQELWPVEEIGIEIEYGIAANAKRTAGASGLLVSGGAFADPALI